VWARDLASYPDIAEWLAQRISEIDAMVREATTIAVLVNSEDHVQPLAEALNARLEEISLAAVACREGRDVGNDRDVIITILILSFIFSSCKIILNHYLF